MLRNIVSVVYTDDFVQVSLINTCSVEADWVQELPGNVTQNFNLVLELFRDKFITNVPSKIANLHEFWNRRQLEGQSAEDFINVMRRTANKIPVTDEAVICHDVAVNGLCDDVSGW